jgi:protein-disulfide isomerase
MRLPSLLLLGVLALGGCGGAPQPPAAAPAASVAAAPCPKEGGPIPVSCDDPVRGKRDALVTIVVFSDFECPFCARGESTLDAIRQKYSEDDLRIVWKDMPLAMHREAMPAALAARAVFAKGGNDAFWKFHDRLFANQRELGDEGYAQWAREAGVADLAASQFGRNDAANKKAVDANVELGSQLGVDGTPAFYINGRPLVGAQPKERFVAIIDEELTAAKAKVAAGTTRDRIYALAVAQNESYRKAAQSDDEEEAEDTTTVWRVPVEGSPVKGSANAAITIVVFSDFQCPFCKRAEPTLAALERAYGDRLRIVWKNEPLPFHKRAVPAATLAIEARVQKGEKAFWAVHDGLMASPGLEDDDFKRIAKEAGLDVKKAMAAVEKNAHKAVIDKDLALAEDVNASGTPHFFINGRRLVGAQPEARFRVIIEEELSKAKALVEKGTAPDKVYDALTKDGKGFQAEKRVVAIPSGAPSLGAKNAKVTIQVFADYQCPYCAKLEGSLKEVLDQYPGKVRVVWRDLPLPMHKDAHLAAEAARAAGEQKGDAGYFRMHDKLFAEQGSPGGLERKALDGYAKEQGLDPKKWAAALDDGKFRNIVDADLKAAEDARIQGTPTMIVGEYLLAGAQPAARIKRLVDLSLSEGK